MCVTLVCFFVIWSLPRSFIFLVFGFQMSESLPPHIGFVDGTSFSAQNLASAAWAIYATTNELISLRGVCLGRATNNIAEYSVVIEFLTDAISLRIRHFVI